MKRPEEISVAGFDEALRSIESYIDCISNPDATNRFKLSRRNSLIIGDNFSKLKSVAKSNGWNLYLEERNHNTILIIESRSTFAEAFKGFLIGVAILISISVCGFPLWLFLLVETLK